MEFSGGLELSKALGELGDEATVAGRRALRGTAKELQEAFVEAAPRQEQATRKYWRRKDGSVGSAMYGQLFQNIRVREAKARADNTIVMMVSTGDAFWGTMLEFGTKFITARPWMRPVFDRMHNSLIAALGRNLGLQIERAARRIERKHRKAGRGGGGY